MSARLFGCAFLLAVAPALSAQTEPRPGTSTSESHGFLTRSSFAVIIAGMKTDDPRFSLVERGRADLDLVAYGKGHVNLFIDTELIMGSERRAFDLNQSTIVFETSASYRLGAIDIGGVAHHVSRHVVDREFDRVPAWHTVGPRIGWSAVTSRTTVDISADYGRIVQHTFVDYRWTSQLTVRIDRALSARTRVFANGSAGLVGVDRNVLGRERRHGTRIETGVGVLGPRAALNLFAAHERRVDAYPSSRDAGSWLEFGVSLSSR